MSKTVRIYVILGVIFVAVTALMFNRRRSPNAVALAAYKAELRAKGEKLSAEDLGFPRPPESSSNLDRLLTGVSQLESAQFEPGMLELMHGVGPGRAEVAWAQPQVRMISTRTANTNTVTWEIYCAPFERAADALQNIRVAVQAPPRYFFNDPTNFLNQAKAPFVPLRTAAQWLMGDAIAALHASQLDRARGDIQALTQLAQFHRDDLMLVSQMIRTAIAGLGLAATWEALQAKGWSEENLAAMQEDWEGVDLTLVLERGMVGERAFGAAAGHRHPLWKCSRSPVLGRLFQRTGRDALVAREFRKRRVVLSSSPASQSRRSSSIAAGRAVAGGEPADQNELGSI